MASITSAEVVSASQFDARAGYGSMSCFNLPGAAATWYQCATAEAAAVAANHQISYGLTFRDFETAYRAIAEANCAGIIVDQCVDVSWSTVGIRSELHVEYAQGALIDGIAWWLRVNKLPACALAVLEIGDRFGLHSHLLLAVPPALADTFSQFCGGFIRNLCNCDLVDTHEVKTINVQSGLGSLDRQWSRFKYMMKGLSPYAALPATERVKGLVPLAAFAEITCSHEGDIRLIRRMRGFTRVRLPPLRALLPDMSFRVDGPQLYGDQFINWHRAMEGKDHCEASLAPRNAYRLVIPRPDMLSPVTMQTGAKDPTG